MSGVMAGDGVSPVGTVHVVADLEGVMDLIAGAGVWDTATASEAIQEDIQEDIHL